MNPCNWRFSKRRACPKRCPLFLKFHELSLWFPQSISRNLFLVAKGNIHATSGAPQPLRKTTFGSEHQAASLDSGWRRARASADRSSRKAQPVEPTRRTRPVPRGRPTLTTHCHGCSRFWRCRLRYPALRSSFLHPPPHSRAARTLGSLLLRLFPVLYGFYGGGAVASASGYCGNGRRRKSGSGDGLSSPRAYGFKPLCF